MDTDKGLNMTTVIYPHTASTFAAVCACLFVAIGVMGNLITIIALIKNQKLRRHPTTAFVLSLCVSDLLFCSINLPLTAARYINEAWIFGMTLCKIFPIIFYSNVAVSLLSMVGITVNRLILIAFTEIYSKIYKPIYVYLQLACVWIIAFALLIPPLLGIWGQFGYDAATFSCTILKKDGYSIKKILFLIGFILPCIVIITSYAYIYYIVRRQRYRMNKHKNSSNYNNNNNNNRRNTSRARSIDSAAISNTNNSNNDNNMVTRNNRDLRERENNRLTIMMLTIFLCFLISFLPLMLVNVFDEINKYPLLHIFASIMAWMSSVINPFIYAASNRTYRIAYFKLFYLIKFWGQPISLAPSKSYVGGASKYSKDLSIDNNDSNNRRNN